MAEPAPVIAEIVPINAPLATVVVPPAPVIEPVVIPAGKLHKTNWLPWIIGACIVGALVYIAYKKRTVESPVKK